MRLLLELKGLIVSRSLLLWVELLLSLLELLLVGPSLLGPALVGLSLE